MPISRIYQPIPLALHQSVELDEQASHHLSRVLRAKVDDEIILFNGQGGEYSARIVSVGKKAIKVTIVEFDPREAASPLNIYLAQGIARGEKMDFIVQKAVELGAKKIIPLITARTNVRLDAEREEKRRQHWQAVAISACEQCGRNDVPAVSSPIALAEWLPQVTGMQGYILSPFTTQTLPPALTSISTPIILLIGPEGGLSDDEIKLAEENGFSPLNLGPRVLRTETASLAALTVFQFCYGDMSIKK